MVDQVQPSSFMEASPESKAMGKLHEDISQLDLMTQDSTPDKDISNVVEKSTDSIPLYS